MKRLIPLFLILLCPRLFSQQVVTTAGSSFSVTGGSISFTIGESIAQTMTSSDKVITIGFQQPNLTVSIISETSHPGYEISAYPNPVSDELTVKLSREGLNNLEYILCDMSGKTIRQGKLNGTLTSIYFNQLRSGMYLIKIIQNNRELKTFKVIKEK